MSDKLIDDVDANTKLNKILDNMMKKQIKVIVIHGASASGKTTFAKNLISVLEKKFRTFLLSTDNFYKSSQSLKENLKKILKNDNEVIYNLDNPFAINFDNIHSTLQALHNEDEEIPIFKYDFFNQQSMGPIYIKNIKPEIIIVEGLYSFNLFNSKIFDIDKFDPYDSSKEGYMKNHHVYENFGILRIRMSICKTRMKNQRVSRDVFERSRTREESLIQFEKQVWPATKKWVNSGIFQADINLIHGSFNKMNYSLLFKSISEKLLGKKYFKNSFTSTSSLVKCSKDCLIGNEKELWLFDDDE